MHLETSFLLPCGLLLNLHSFPTRRSSDLMTVVVIDAGGFALQRPGAGATAAEDVAAVRDSGRALQRVRLFRNRRIGWQRSEEHTSELQSRLHLVCRLLPDKK